MTQQTAIQSTVVHGSFTIEREYPVAVDRVFAAWTSTEKKSQWFAQSDGFVERMNEYTLDFRVGGFERLDARLTSGSTMILEARYYDIVPNERIVAAYDILINDRRISVSIYSVLFQSTPAGTRLITTEDGAFLDGLDDNDSRQKGVTSDLDGLGRYLEHNDSASTR